MRPFLAFALSRSSSQAQDTGFSSLQQGFKSPTGRHFDKNHIRDILETNCELIG